MSFLGAIVVCPLATFSFLQESQESMSDLEEEGEEGGAKKPNMLLGDRKAIYFMLKVQEADGQIPRAAIKNCARHFPITPK